ncbi:MAG: HD domain-containing protein [Armatimonadetes bacterium]|nr:HD domain-containing protein [Armatimonadota bacterium]
MPDSSITPGVLITSAMAIGIFGISIYVSRVFLPRKIKRAYLNSISVLASAVETRYTGTLGHAKRVAEYTVELARRLGIECPILERIEYGALLMDMGKANVPQVILKKREPLTIAEWEILQTHPRKGAEMVASVPFLAHLQDIILHHHEYWDGTGYPDGLIGEEIPLESRILSIAADYDAMVSERSYRSGALTPDEALAEIELCLGRRYDPRVGEKFIDMIRQEMAEPCYNERRAEA